MIKYYEDIAARSPLEMNEFDLCVMWHSYPAYVVSPSPLNVKNFGAVGDGETDDTAAIQAAVDARKPGQKVDIPPGAYYLSRPIFIEKKS
jgi:hypothetical protein